MVANAVHWRGLPFPPSFALSFHNRLWGVDAAVSQTKPARFRVSGGCPENPLIKSFGSRLGFRSHPHGGGEIIIFFLQGTGCPVRGTHFVLFDLFSK